jgi:hypothetical protein
MLGAMFVTALAMALTLAATHAPDVATPGATPAAATPGMAFSKKPRRAQPRNVVPDEIQALLPWKGLYAAGGGLAAPTWRVVVTLEGDLRAGSDSRPGASATALVDKKRKKLPPAVLGDLIALADRAWRDRSARKSPPSADYAELLVIADGEQVFFLDPKGPLPGAAARLVERLKSEAAAP